MAMDFDADLDVMLSDTVFGVAVVYGAQSTSGILDDFTEDVLDGQMSAVPGQVRFVDIRTGALSALVRDAAITVDGTARRIRDLTQPSQYADGRLTRLWLWAA